LVALSVTAAAGALPFWAYFGASELSRAVGMSVVNTLSVLGFRKEFTNSALLDSLPGVLTVLAGLQSITGIIFLFLFGLAVRNRFRIK